MVAALAWRGPPCECIHAVSSSDRNRIVLDLPGGLPSTQVEPLTSQTDPAQLDPGERAALGDRRPSRRPD